MPRNIELRLAASSSPDNALEPVLVPLDGLLLVDLVGGTDLGLAAPALGDALTGAGPAGTVSG